MNAVSKNLKEIRQDQSLRLEHPDQPLGLDPGVSFFGGFLIFPGLNRR